MLQISICYFSLCETVWITQYNNSVSYLTGCIRLVIALLLSDVMLLSWIMWSRIWVIIFCVMKSVAGFCPDGPIVFSMSIISQMWTITRARLLEIQKKISSSNITRHFRHFRHFQKDWLRVKTHLVWTIFRKTDPSVIIINVIRNTYLFMTGLSSPTLGHTLDRRLLSKEEN